MNEAGVLIGGFSNCAGEVHSFVWNDGQITSPIPGLDDVDLLDINLSGQIVGTRETVLIQGYIFQEGVITDFGTLPGGTFSEALAISEDGKVVGYWGNQVTGMPSKHAFIWHDGVMTDIDVLPRMNHTAEDVNEKGQLTGWMGVGTFPPHYGEAYIWSDGVTTPLGYPKGGTNSEGRALNDLGDVCGHYRIPNPGIGGAFRRACLWTDGMPIDLGLLPGCHSSYATDLNDQRQVVGYAEGPAIIQAFLWQNGVMARLNDLVPADLGVNIRYGEVINNTGQIAANGIELDSGRQVALRLTPIAPPPGDCNCDGHADIDDLLSVIREWGPAIPTTTADFDLNGAVDMDDLFTVLMEWD
jgi:probable HAF family extracellular repeat protein